MNVTPLDTAGALRGAGSGTGTGGSQAWLQQLQRAQSAGWFHRADRLPASRDESEPPQWRGGSSHPGSGKTDAPRWLPGTQAVSIEGSHGVPARLASPTLPNAEVLLPPSATPSTQSVSSAIASPGEALAAWQPSGALPDPLESPEWRPPTSSGARRDVAPPVRIHIEDGEQGLRLWLGLDGTPAEVAARASAVALELRRLCARSGLEVASITCNGIPIADAAHAPHRSRKEP